MKHIPKHPETLPGYLRKVLSWRKYSSPPPGSLDLLPFDSLSPQEFERFCLHFFLKQFGYFEGFRLHGVSGQRQQGYDIWTIQPDGTGVFAECKRRKKVDLAAAVRKFRSSNHGLTPKDCFWFFTSADLRERDKQIQSVIHEHSASVRVIVYDSHRLTEELRSRAAVFGDLVEMTFGSSWSSKLYNGMEWMVIMFDYWRERDVFSKVLARKGVYETLKELYPQYSLLRFNGRQTPVTVFPANESEWPNIETACTTPLVSTDVPAPDEYGETFDPAGVQRFYQLRALEKGDPKHYWNGATYVMQQLKTSGPGCKLHCKMGRYFQAAATCDALEQELIEALSQRPGSALTLEALPRRRWLHDRLSGEDPVLLGAYRSAAIAISTLIVFFHGELNRHCFLIHERSTRIQAHPYRFHVIPSFMFQPTVRPDEPHLEYSVRHNILREFLEEVYNVPDVRKEHGEANPKWFYEERPVKRLLRMLNSSDPTSRADLYYTGLAVNLMNLRTEICTLLLIRDSKWFQEESAGPRSEKHIICFNDEYLSEEEASQIPRERRLDRDKLRIYMELGSQLEMVKPELMRPENLVPPAAAAIHLGLRVAKYKLGIA